MLRIGHRGAAGLAPENTLMAIEAGIAADADFVELDVQRTNDGQFVIMHDKRVDRTTNGSGRVTEMNVDQLRCLDAGRGQRIPLLEEVLSIANGRVGLLLEIITPGISSDLFRAVQLQEFQGSVIFASFHHRELLSIPGGPRLALLEGIPVEPTMFALEARSSHVGLSVESITSDFISALHDANLQVFVYTVNDRRDVDWLSSLGVDGIISDHPEMLPKS